MSIFLKKKWMCWKDMKRIYPFIFFLLFPVSVLAQKHRTVSGYISDQASSERLAGAGVRLLPGSKTGIISNSYGFYSLTLPEGEITLVCSSVGYQSDTVHFLLSEDTTVDFNLKEIPPLKEVVVHSQNPIDQRNDIGKLSIPTKDLATIPSLMGEKDILKALQLLPGVQTGNDGNTGLFVRGGSPDQNLILLDGMPVYNVSHLLGFLSVFTPEALQSIDLYKGGFPARYGGRLSSILDIRMKEGNLKEMKGNVAVGLLSSKFTLEGPLKKEKSSFLITGRRSYIDLLAKPFFAFRKKRGESDALPGYYFDDFTAKFNYILHSKDRLYLSFYGGEDNFHIQSGDIDRDSTGTKMYESKTNAGLRWGNLTAALRWNRQWNPKLFSNTSLSFSKFRYSRGFKSRIFEREDSGSEPVRSETILNYYSHIRDLAAHVDFDYSPSPNLGIKFGAAFILHHFQPGVSVHSRKIDTTHSTPVSNADKIGGHTILSKEVSAYVEDEISLGDRMKMNVGVRSTLFFVEDRSYFSLQPRFKGRYLLNKGWSIKGGYARMFQPLHLLSNFGVGMPTDLWVSATSKIPPEKSHQFSLGLAKSFKEQYEFSAEIYYKSMEDVIAYKNGANFSQVNEDWQEKVEIGSGSAFGMDLLIRKTMGSTTGWIGYTLAKTQRRFPGINGGKKFPYKFDRRHDLKFTLVHHFSDRLQFSFNWVFASGNVITLPSAKYNIPYNNGVNTDLDYYIGSERQYVDHIPSRNNLRMRSYHRLDLSFDFIKNKKKGVRTWNVSLFNAYSRQNSYYYFYERQRDNSYKLKQFSLFPILPSVSYSFQFK